MRSLLQLSYRGTNYHGWQRQSELISVQQVLEETLSDILSHRILLHGCGRTDAGVHASQYFAHFDFTGVIPSEFIFIANKRLPEDIAIHQRWEIPNNFSAQYHALNRTYTYLFHLEKNALLVDRSAWFPEKKINLDLIEKAINIFRKTEDFKYFCRTPERHNHTRCEIESLSIDKSSTSDSYKIEITADRFLRGMIRILADKLIQIGAGKLNLDLFEQACKGETPFKHLNLAPAQGLYLSGVRYAKVNSIRSNDLFP